MSHTHTFRRARLSDAAAISHLIGSTWAESFAWSVSEDDLKDYLENVVPEKKIEEELGDGTKRFWVAVSDVPPSSGQDTPAAAPENSLRVQGPAKSDEDHNYSDGNVNHSSSPDSTSPYQYILGVAQIHLPSGTSPCPGLLTSPDRLFMLNRLYLHSSTHGSGVASLLLKKAEEDVKALEGKGIWLGCWEDNKRGRRFYEKMGYEEKGRVEFMLGKSRRIDWVMEKVL